MSNLLDVAFEMTIENIATLYGEMEGDDQGFLVDALQDIVSIILHEDELY